MICNLNFVFRFFFTYSQYKCFTYLSLDSSWRPMCWQPSYLLAMLEAFRLAYISKIFITFMLVPMDNFIVFLYCTDGQLISFCY